MSDPIPTALEYFPEVPRTDSSAQAWFVYAMPLLVVVVISMFYPPGALLGGAFAFFLLWLRKRAAKKLPHARLEIREGRFLVFDRKEHPIVDVPLDGLLEVSLDTKTIQKVQENLSSGMPELRFVDSRVGPGIDNSRIEFVTSSSTTPLTEFYTSSIDANEWFSKIRRLLRKNGWVPLDERAS